MHRQSVAEYPVAPLSHHTFDSTHVSFGVVTAALDRGPFVVEGSLFNGREPDDNRWDFDFGPLDSVSGRVWYRLNDRWEFQVSTGHLKHPEELDPSDIQRTTVSGSWLRQSGDGFTAVTVGYGVNATDEANRHAVFGELTRRAGRNSVFTRVEALQVETDLLLHDVIPLTAASAARKDAVATVTIGAVRDLPAWRGFEGGVGAAATFYVVPDTLRSAYGDHPVSFQVYFRIRPPAGKMGRMWNMRMSQAMAGRVRGDPIWTAPAADLVSRPAPQLCVDDEPAGHADAVASWSRSGRDLLSLVGPAALLTMALAASSTGALA
jgi:hypothetical protein